MKTVLILEDVYDTRQWLCDIVTTTFPGADIIQADSVRAASQHATRAIDLALIDLGLPDGSGIDVLRLMSAAKSTATKVVTTVMGDDVSIVSALSAGADGYLLKENTTGVLAHQLAQLTHGLPAISPSVARRIMEHFRLTGPSIAQEARLTARETQVLGLIARGLRNAEVASDMGISDHTVADYIKIIYRKLGISSRAEASWHAARLGLYSESAP